MAASARGCDSGTDDVALALYLALRAQGPCTPDKAAAELGLGAPEARAGWAELRELGLVRAGRYSQEVDCVEPDTALMGLLDRQRAALRAQSEELAAIVRAAESLTGRYRPAVLRDTAEVEVEVISGARRKQQLLGEFSDLLQHSTSSMHPGPLPPAEVLTRSLEIDGRLVQRGIQVRAIYTQGVSSAPRQRKYLGALSAAGVEVRLAPQVPLDLIVGDSSTAILPAYPDEPADAVILVRGPALVRSYVALYEDCWLRSVAYQGHCDESEGCADQLTEQHRTTMRLLANGLTDERIARKLGVSLRTVSRLVSEVMRHLDAESRFQAGALAAAQGLI
ncbi:helix-turn-helix transcriptional regulator [Streptomyces sp. URMC 123]|uniref:helix-turn-helix transcriptional regulator n=1 Tax=Streptomyces sp. URMC 123 TaxID=3423403 RepID=UPI003F1D1A84